MKDIERSAAEGGIQTSATLATDLPQTKEKLRLVLIPRLLYREISERLGVGDEVTMDTCYGPHRIHALDSSHPSTGFEGAIGLREAEADNLSFRLWGRMPTPGDCDYHDQPRTLLRIHGWPADAGVWTCVSGTLHTDRLDAELEYGGFSLEDPAGTLISLILMRANQYARSPDLVKASFWDGYGR